MYCVRWLIRRDVPEVLSIDQRAFVESWQEDDILRPMRTPNHIGMVAELGEKVVGFMVYELRKSRLVVKRFAVDKDHWRAGVGRRMIDKLKSKLSSHRRNRMSIDVADDNLTAHLFLRAMDFHAMPVSLDTYRFVYHAPVEDFA